MELMYVYNVNLFLFNDDLFLTSQKQLVSYNCLGNA